MTPATRDQLDELLREAVEGEVTPGCVALCWGAGGLRYQGHFGALASHPSAPTRAPVTLDTVYDLASLTKVLSTTTLIAQAVGVGRLRLEDLLPAALSPVAGPRPSLGALLEHASGLAAHREYFFEPYALEVNQPAALLAAIKATPRACAPGTQAIYSDLGFMLLGAWLELLHQAPLDQLFQREVAEPLGLADQIGFHRLSALPLSPERGARCAATEVYDPALHGGARQRWYGIREGLGQAVAHGIVHDDNCLIMDGVAGHAGLFGTAEAALTIAKAWLEGALPGLSRAQAKTVVDRFTTPSGVPASTRRLGFDGPEPDGGGSTGGALSPGAFGHLGFTGTSVWMDPKARTVHVLLSNRVHPTRSDTRIRALRRAFHRLAAAQGSC